MIAARISQFSLALAAFVLLGSGRLVAQNTVVTAPSASMYAGSAGYTTLGDIVFTENGGKSFTSATGAYSVWFVLPTGFQFNTAVTPTHGGSSGQFAGFTTTYFGSSLVRISFNYTLTGGSDNWRVIGLQVRALAGYENLTSNMTIATSNFTMLAPSTDNIAVLTTYQDINGGNIQFSSTGNDDENLCPGEAVSFSINGFGEFGGSGSAFTYRWERSTNLSTWTTITSGGGANNLTAGDIGAPAQTTYYRRWARKDGADSAVSEIATITLRPQPVASLSGVNPSYCLNGATDVLSGNPAGGVYALSINAGAYNTFTNPFNPTTASVGTGSFRYIYTDGFGCSDTAFVNSVPFSAPPTAAFTKPLTTPSLVNTDTVGITLGGSNPGVGGSFYFFGPGVVSPAPASSDSARFVPAWAGATGNVDIYYVATTLAGCSDTAQMTINVQSITGGGLIGGLDASYCINGPIDPLTKQSDAYLYIYSNFFGWQLVAGLGTTTYNFDPSLRGTGTFLFEHYNPFTYPSDYQLTSVPVYPSPKLILLGLPATVCSGDEPVNMVGYYNSPSIGWTIETASGTLFTSNTNPSDGVTATQFLPGHPGNSTPVTVFWTFQDANSCRDTVFQTTNLVSTPTVNLNFLSDTPPHEFCRNAPGDTMVGTPAGGSILPTGGLAISYVSTLTQARVRPEISTVGDWYAVYRYMAGGCIGYDTLDISILDVPQGIIETTPLGRVATCINDAPLTLTGSSVPAAGPGTFFDNGAGYITPAGGFTATFNPSTAGVGNNYPIYYRTPLINGCRDTAVYFLTVNDTISTTLLFTDVVGAPEDTVICATNTPNIWLTGVPTGGTYATLPGSVVTVNPATGAFTPNTVGIARFAYSVVSGAGCANTDSVQIYINPTPATAFAPLSLCVDAPIDFDNQTTLAGGPRSDNVQFSYWRYSATLPEEELAGLSDGLYSYAAPGSYLVRLRTVTDRGCTDQVSNLLQFGAPPAMNFTWVGECEGDLTNFTDLSTSTNPIVSRFWDFGDGNDQLNVTNNLAANTYGSAGVYPVSLTATTDLGCAATLLRLIAIREVVNTYPYVFDFEGGNEGWFEEIITGSPNDFNSWELGTPAGSTIVGAASGSNAWMTRLDSSYKNLEMSAVRGPCFDLSPGLIERPMVEFYYWSESNAGTDGTVLQASVNDGVSWTNVGVIGSGLEWFSRFGVVGLLPPQLSSTLATGWSGSSGGWVKARHSLDDFLGQVALLRFAFGSDGGTGNDGFAFDSLVIRERERTVLLENFTNSSSSLSFSGDLAFNALVAANASDVIDIQYHTQFPGSDPMNALNPADPSGRAFYYGINSVPTAVMDGNAFQGATASLTQQQIDLRSLVDVEFDINVIDFIRTATQVQVSIEVLSRNTSSGRRLNLQIALVEDTMIFSPALFNGEDLFRSVLKKMLPSASGTTFTHSWAAGQTDTATYVWNIPASYFADPNRMKLIAFLQDDDTDEVLQSVTTGTITGSVITGIEDFVAHLRKSPLRIYPNPAFDYTTLDFGAPMPKSGYVDVVSEMGIRVAQVPVAEGRSEVQMAVSQWPSGLYLLRLVVDGQIVGKQSLIVAH